MGEPRSLRRLDRSQRQMNWMPGEESKRRGDASASACGGRGAGVSAAAASSSREDWNGNGKHDAERRAEQQQQQRACVGVGVDVGVLAQQVQAVHRAGAPGAVAPACRDRYAC